MSEGRRQFWLKFFRRSLEKAKKRGPAFRRWLRFCQAQVDELQKAEEEKTP